jgi:hypothetical protein
VQQHLGIAARLEDRAGTHELVPELARIDEVAVVRDSNLSVCAVDKERLCVAQPAFTGGRVSRMTDREVAR